MKSTFTQGHMPCPSFSKLFLALAMVSLLGSGSAYARDNDEGRNGHQDNGKHRGEQRYDRHDNGHRNEYRDRRDPYFYNAPVYAPAPVYYDQRPSPGISLFFPIDIRR